MPDYPDTPLYRAITGGRFPVIVSLARHDMALARAAKDAGVDALKIHLNAYHRAGKVSFGSFTEERPFLEELATLGLPLLVMAGQETLPSPEELEALADLGFEGFNVYFAHMQPHMLQSRLRPMPALADSSTDADLETIAAIPGAMVEASITRFADYGKPLTDEDVAAYRSVVERAGIPVIAPSQKKFVPADMARLKGAGVAAALLGVIVTGDTPSSLASAVPPIVAAARAA
ncbi:hypothetical protein EMQ25_16560 [Arsenicitalea aurantiaca]|uniref:Uncharacterized protein n=1 Tax=Arsenicitalea aurantiaca TaxID=1783274 RepID=A0A433X3D8_9HYPH|nr:hypothetical protein [Arsenicitalea aurantiaca]RUT28583.1 hypothetical protein EMQ25_16560 [Arsenicitalea aurantiaca]